MKRILVLFLASYLSVNLSIAQSGDKVFFVTTNLLAPWSGVKKDNAVLTLFLPVLSNLEYGFTWSGGFVQDHHFVETRITIGQSNNYNFLPQLQVGYGFLPFFHSRNNRIGVYLGTAIRYWDYINLETKTQRHNLSPNVLLGYRFQKNRFIIDLRLHQSIAILSKTNIPHTKTEFGLLFSAMPGLSKVLPMLSINVGYQLNH
jgi:hypothetical protein